MNILKQRLFLMALATLALSSLLGSVTSAQQFACVDPDNLSARPIYMINPGSDGDCPDCDQDYDGDLAEYLDFRLEHGLTDRVQGIVGDMFPWCTEGFAHGEIVAQYFRGFGPSPAEINMSQGMEQLVNGMVGAMTGNAAVGNLSVSETYEINPDRVAAFLNAYDSGLLLVGVPPAFGHQKEMTTVCDKVISLYKADQSAPSPCGDEFFVENFCGILFAAMWTDDQGRMVVGKPGSAIGSGPPYDSTVWGYTDSGSFITPMAAGAMTGVMAVVEARGLTGGDLVGQTIDYIVSACDHPDDSFAVRSATLTSYAPWSHCHFYGYFNPWKAMLYATGYGRIASRDNEWYGVENPVTAFNDHFEMRGDLLVEEGQHLHIGSMASVTVANAYPEGPSYGVNSSLHEIRVDGELTIAGDVNVSMVIGATGVVTVEETGTLALGQGRGFVIEPGGTLIINGTTVVDGYLSNNGGMMVLNADLNIGETGGLYVYNSAVITIGDIDLMAGGSNSAEVEIDCAGQLIIAGQTGYPVIVRADNPLAGDWAGIALHSDRDLCIFANTEISNAVLALDMSGSTNMMIYDNIFADNEIGLKIVGRDTDTIDSCVFTGSDIGMLLMDADPAVNECEFDSNGVGIACESGSRPKLRDSVLSNNLLCVRAVATGTAPDLGTIGDPGNNTFLAPGKMQNFVAAFDIVYDIHAKYNWWGSTNEAVIASKMVVMGSTREIIYLPLLTSPPVPSAAADGGARGVELASEKSMDSAAEARLSFMPSKSERFGAGVTIAFRTPNAGNVDLSVFDLRGRKVRALTNGFLTEGEHRVTWDGSDATGRRSASGVYLVRLISNQQTVTTKVMFAR